MCARHSGHTPHRPGGRPRPHRTPTRAGRGAKGSGFVGGGLLFPKTPALHLGLPASRAVRATFKPPPAALLSRSLNDDDLPQVQALCIPLGKWKQVGGLSSTGTSRELRAGAPPAVARDVGRLRSRLEPRAPRPRGLGKAPPSESGLPGRARPRTRWPLGPPRSSGTLSGCSSRDQAPSRTPNKPASVRGGRHAGRGLVRASGPGVPCLRSLLPRVDSGRRSTGGGDPDPGSQLSGTCPVVRIRQAGPAGRPHVRKVC